MRYDGLTDEEILTCIETGEKAAIDYLMDKYKDVVRKKAKALYLIGGDKEDLIQEGMIGLYKAMRDFQKDKGISFFSFADLCISRQMYTAIKHSNTKKNQPLNNYISIDISDDIESNEKKDFTILSDTLLQDQSLGPEETFIDQETVTYIRNQLNSVLSPMEQEVLSLYLKNKNYTDIAEILKKEPKAVDNALQRIKKKLVEILRKD